MKHIVFIAFLAAAALIVLPTTLLLLVGCLPSVIAFYVDRRPRKSTAMALFSMNIAAASYFVFQLWFGSHTITNSLGILADPMSIVVMYGGAMVGYILDTVLGGMINEIMYIKAQKRLEFTEKEQGKLIKRWGKAVTANQEKD